MLDKKSLSERDICTKYITPALQKSGWDIQTQILEEVAFTDGRIVVRGQLTTRGERKRADYILYYKRNIPIAIIEAKDNKHNISSGMQQALNYGQILDIPCIFSSNGDGFMFHDRSNTEGVTEEELSLDNFPSPLELWQRYKLYKGIESDEEERIAAQDYHYDINGKQPRYYQQIAINRTVEAIAKQQDRILLVMATGTGKTYTAFQIVYRLMKAGIKKRVLFLADRKILVSQADKAFDYFKNVKTTVLHRKVDKSYELYFALYQGLSGNEEEANIYKQFSPDFFDLIVIDECHRGSAKDDSAWREILTYFKKATHIGLTATPKETNDVSNSDYFGEPLYTYSLKQGIDDGFLAPYRVVKVDLGMNIGVDQWRPEAGKKDKTGISVDDRIYNRLDFDKNLVIEERTKKVAEKVTQYLKGTNRFDKTIIFCVDIDHAERMRSALVNLNGDLVSKNDKYIVRITGDDEIGKKELDNFINPEEVYPVIATTSKLLTTGVDAQTCKLIVLDSNIQSMTEFKQIIGRGTRINEEYGKLFFTILDFRNVTDLFADPNFDGDPVKKTTYGGNVDLSELALLDEDDIQNDYPVQEIVPPSVRTPFGNIQDNGGLPQYRNKIVVNGIDVSILHERELHFNREGKLITTKLTDFTKSQIEKKFASLTAFLSHWHEVERKEFIIQELKEQGVMLEELQDSVDRELDIFDLICHVAYNQKPLTRRERANNVKKRNIFARYGTQAQKVIEALLEKYADNGIEEIENSKILRLDPISSFGTPSEIISWFGGKSGFEVAIRELKNEIYKSA
jgi:type I restriction enzyme, R subunit